MGDTNIQSQKKGGGSMKDKIIQISTHWAWRGNYEDSCEQVYGLGESGKVYILWPIWNNGEITGHTWRHVVDSPETKEGKI